GILHLFQRRRYGRCRRGLSGRRGADSRDRPRTFCAGPSRAWPSRSDSAAEAGGSRRRRQRHCWAGRLCRLPGRRQYHAVGLRTARPIEGDGVSVLFSSWPDLSRPSTSLLDEDDLAYFLTRLPGELPVCVVGVGSNLIVRDGGIPGVVIRLSPRGFGETEAKAEIISAGAAALDRRVAETAAASSLSGLEFFFGIPGTIGGALRMNAGANGAETKDVLIEAIGLGRDGKKHVLSNAEMKFVYRNSGADTSVIFTSARFRGQVAAPEAIRARMDEVQNHRETAQPIREKTGGSTFKNPPGQSAWKLIDAAGCRGLRLGGAQ